MGYASSPSFALFSCSQSRLGVLAMTLSCTALAIVILAFTSSTRAVVQTLSHILPTPVPIHTEHARQETRTTTFIPTKTITVTAANAEDSPSPTSSYVLQPATTPIDIAATIGLVMPNPWSDLYVGVNYTFGFVDAVKRPAPTTGGWIRYVQPLILFPNYTLAILPGSGALSPKDSVAIPEGSGGLCGATAERYSMEYPFRFEKHGWHMFVLNQTYQHPTIDTDNTCQLPITEELFFFATQTFSVKPAPTTSPGPADPTGPFTVFNKVTVQTPGNLPYEKQPSTATERLAVGLGVTGGALALAGIAVVVWWVKKKRSMEAETLAFSRLSDRDKAAFLAENPEHFLNPDRRLRDSLQPPAPPGTLSYAQWYWQQLWDRQQGRGRWASPAVYGQGQVGQGWAQTMEEYQSMPTYPQQALQTVQQPIMVYKTY